MRKNVELAYSTLDYIREHPEEWNQRVYLCGSTACYAGRAVLIEAGLENSAQLVKQYPSPNIPAMAREALGWSYEESNHVFTCFTTDFGVLERRVKEVLNGEVQ